LKKRFDFVTMLELIKGLEAPHFYLSYLMDTYKEFMQLTGCEQDSKRFIGFYVGFTSVKIPTSSRGADFIKVLDESFSETPTTDMDAQMLAFNSFTEDMLDRFTGEEILFQEGEECMFFFNTKGAFIYLLGAKKILGFLTSDNEGLYVKVYDPYFHKVADYVDEVSHSEEFIHVAREVMAVPTGRLS
jgi:hypothetical protein